MNALQQAVAKVQALPTAAQIGLLILVILEIGIQAYAVVIAVRTPDERLTLKRWIWVILCLFNWIGAVVFLVAGRKPVQVADMAPAAPVASRAEAAADALYGARNDESAR